MVHVKDLIKKIIVIDKFIIIDDTIYKVDRQGVNIWTSCDRCDASETHCLSSKPHKSNICSYVMYPPKPDTEEYEEWSRKVILIDINNPRNIVRPGQVLISRVSHYEMKYLWRKLKNYVLKSILGMV